MFRVYATRESHVHFEVCIISTIGRDALCITVYFS